MSDSERFNYDVLTAFKESFYASLLTNDHITRDRIRINLGDRECPDYKIVYVLQKDPKSKKYALAQEHIDELPILIKECVHDVAYRDMVVELITKFSSAKFTPQRNMSFRQIVDDLCNFEHSDPIDFKLWRIICLAALTDRLVCRVSSPPAFGKDSVMKVLGHLTNKVCVIANPTVAKLEYRLTYKVLMLNEFANLKPEAKHDVEHFLQATGDLSPVYEKRSMAVITGTLPTYNIGHLSVVATYNDVDCYTDDKHYFDNVFGEQTKQRFIPFRFKGKITQELPRLPNAHAIANKNREYYRALLQSLMWYREHWHEEYEAKKEWKLKSGRDYGFIDRWAANFDTIVRFIRLYANSEEEAQGMIGTLYNRHLSYLEMVGPSTPWDNRAPREFEWLEKESAQIHTEERIGE